MAAKLSQQWDERAIAPGLQIFPETEWAERAAEREATDRDDLEKERSGMNVKRARFSSSESRFGLRQGETDKQKAQASFLLSMAEMASPSYRQAYMRFTRTCDIALRDALEARDEIEQEKQRLRLVMEHQDQETLRISGGRKVYVGNSGGFFDESGRILTGADRAEASVAYRENPDATTWDQHNDVARLWADAQKREQEVDRYVEKVKEMQAQGGNMDEKHLNAAQRDIIDSAPPALRERIERDVAASEPDADEDEEWNPDEGLDDFAEYGASDDVPSPEDRLAARETSYAKADGGGISTTTSIKTDFLASSRPTDNDRIAEVEMESPTAAPVATKPPAI